MESPDSTINAQKITDVRMVNIAFGRKKMVLQGIYTSWSFDKLIVCPNDTSKRRARQYTFGNTIQFVGPDNYIIRFDNGTERNCDYNVLKIETSKTVILSSETEVVSS